MAKITIIGTGLIGTSLALALRQSRLQNLELVGTDANNLARSGAQKSGAFNKVENRLLNAISGSNIVVLATPIMAMKELMEIMAPELEEGCVVTDVGSSKKMVLDWADEHLPRTVDFVGGHPMAGKETSGPEAADGTLFQGKPYCVIPSQQARQQAAAEITTMVEAIGATPYFIGIDEHDSFVAAVSHLPFMMSMALMRCASSSANWDDIAQLASSGFRDMTRLASGDTIMHRDICIANPEPIVAWIDNFIRELYEIRKILASEDGPDAEAVKGAFDQAFEARAKWQAGLVGPRSRDYNSSAEVPSFAESMGEMFAGRRAMNAQKRILGGWLDRGRKKE